MNVIQLLGTTARDSQTDAVYISISPAFSGKTEWSFDVDGALNIGSHGEYTIQPVNGDLTVDIEMWGGGGASGWLYTSTTAGSNEGPGGGGGYAEGTLVLKDGVDYILRIGEGGSRRTSNAGATSAATYVAGGVGTANGAEGGGYSGIFKTSVSQANAKLMAGGGGGGYDTTYGSSGGAAGGGSSGQNQSDTNQGGDGGTQSAGGAASIYNNATAGSALTGGVGQNVVNSSHGGGGGGYYGGGGGNVGGGGGGSGYIDTADADLTNESTTAGNNNVPGNSAGTNRGGAGDGGVGSAGIDGRIWINTT